MSLMVKAQVTLTTQLFIKIFLFPDKTEMFYMMYDYKLIRNFQTKKVLHHLNLQTIYPVFSISCSLFGRTTLLS